LKAKAAAIGIADRVHYAGRLDEAGTLAAIGAADALVLTSFMEGLPVVLMEALALNVPVVASRVAGVPELVEDGVTGLLVTPADWSEFAAALLRLEADPVLRQRLAMAGHQRVAAEFSYPAAVHPMANLLKGCLVTQ
jgi:glycosyltransferase involved in cell wall biosynthesis